MSRPNPPDSSLPPLEQLKSVVAQLRSPNGCPWDKEQIHESLRAGLLEEAYEVVAAIDAQDEANLKEELGDLLLQVVFHSQIATEESRFDFDAVALEITQKLIRRHPHVFENESAKDSAEVLVRWEEIKRAEKGAAATVSALDGVSPGLPSLQYAAKIQKRAAQCGFDWDAVVPVLAKVREELEEVEESLREGGASLEEELGDLLFSVVNLTRKLKVDAEVALHGATNKFKRRFQAVESLAQERGIVMKEESLESLDLLWEQVKREAKAQL
ncbi:MAG: nucleoside triphosphate pyrophosphohydrolase [Verrucomicrobiota bacterium]